MLIGVLQTWKATNSLLTSDMAATIHHLTQNNEIQIAYTTEEDHLRKRENKSVPEMAAFATS